MSYFEEQLLCAWVILVTLIYPIFFFKGQARLRDQLDRLHKKLNLLKHEKSDGIEVTKSQSISAPQPPPQLPIVKEAEIELEPEPKSDIPPPLPPKPPVLPAPLPPKPLAPPVYVRPLHQPGAFELAAKGLLSRIWNWILVGEEYRKPGVSVEFAVATNWLVRVGVLVLVVGVGFFLDYSARMGWLGDAGKVWVAVGAGVALLAGGMLNLNRKYHLLGQGLVGAGLAILYTAMFAAHQRYGLIPPVAAFVLMFLVTLGAAGISIYSRSLLIAVLGLIGGYLTPFLLPESGEVSGLLVYLAVLGMGVLMISLRRQWFILNFMAFLFTSLHVFAMLAWWRDPVSFLLGMTFFVLYFLLFSTSAFLFQVLQKEKSTWLDLAFLLMNAGGFFLSARRLIPENTAREWISLLSLLLALFYAVHLFVFIKRKGADKGLALCFLSLMSFFLLLTIPVYFTGEWWTVAWSLLALVLLWGSRKVNSCFLEQVALGIFTLSLLRYLQLDLTASYGTSILPGTTAGEYISALLERLVQMGVPLLSLGGAMWLQNHPQTPWPEFHLSADNDCASPLKPEVTVWTLRGLLLAVGLTVVHLEITKSFGFLYPPSVPMLLTFTWVFGGWVLLRWTQKYPAREALQTVLLIFAIALMVKWIALDVPAWDFSMSTGRYNSYNFMEAGFRLLDFLLRCGFFVYSYLSFSSSESTRDLRNFFGYAALGNLWLYSTFEVNSLLADFIPGLRSGGLSVFWGLFALALVSAGLFKRHRPLRLLGLAQFTWVAVKVFFYDLASLDPIYKIVAFILLGMVLLAGAFSYLRFQDRFPLDSEPDSGKEAG